MLPDSSYIQHHPTVHWSQITLFFTQFSLFGFCHINGTRCRKGPSIPGKKNVPVKHSDWNRHFSELRKLVNQGEIVHS